MGRERHPAPVVASPATAGLVPDLKNPDFGVARAMDSGRSMAVYTDKAILHGRGGDVREMLVRGIP
jgi:hypothetical protein